MEYLKKEGVSTFGRLMFEALAGKAFVKVKVELIDTTENRKVGEFEASGMSSGGSIFAGTTSQTEDMIQKYMLHCRMEKTLLK